MRYWLIYTGTSAGPYEPTELWRQPDFSLESLVCPEDRNTEALQNWKPAKQYPDIDRRRMAPELEKGGARSATAKPAGEAAPAGDGGGAIQFGNEGPVIGYQPRFARRAWPAAVLAASLLAGGFAALYYARRRPSVSGVPPVILGKAR